MSTDERFGAAGSTRGVLRVGDTDVPGVWISDGDGAAVFQPDDPDAAGFDQVAYSDGRYREWEET